MFGILKKYDVHLCSEVHGRVTHNGEPVAGATVKRWLQYIDKEERVDTTETDSDGKFSLPKVEIRSKLPGDMFAQDRTYQQIGVTHRETSYVLWNSTLSGIKEPPEYREKLQSLNADLKDPEVDFTFPNSANPNIDFDSSSICRWDKNFEIFELEDEDEDDDFFGTSA